MATNFYGGNRFSFGNIQQISTQPTEPLIKLNLIGPIDSTQIQAGTSFTYVDPQVALRTELEGTGTTGDGTTGGGGTTGPETTILTPPYINVKQYPPVGLIPIVPFGLVDDETGSGGIDVPVDPIIGTVPVLSFPAGPGGVGSSPTKPIRIPAGYSGQFQVSARKSTRPGTIVFRAIKNAAAESATITINPPTVSGGDGITTTATYYIESRTGSQGQFRIDVQASTEGVDNEPLDSNIISIYGEVYTEVPVISANATVIPLRSLINFTQTKFELPVSGNTQIIPFEINQGVRISVPDFRITDILLSIVDPAYNPPVNPNNRFSATRVGSGYAFNVSSNNYDPQQGTIHGTLTIIGKTNTTEIQTVIEDLVFIPTRNINEFVRKLQSTVEIENGSRATIDLFEIHPTMIVVEVMDVSYDSDQVIFEDPFVNFNKVQVRAYNVTGFQPVGFTSRIGVRFADDTKVTHIENTGTIITKVIEPPPPPAPPHEPSWPDVTSAYISVSNPPVNIDQTKGESARSVQIGRVLSTDVTYISILPTSIPNGMEITLRNYDNVVNKTGLGIYADVRITDFELARGEHTVQINSIISLKKGANTAERPLGITLPIQIIKENSSAPTFSSRSIIFNVVPTLAHSIDRLVEVQEINQSNEIVDQYFINNGELNRGWNDGTKLRIIPSQNKKVDGLDLNLIKIQGFSPRWTEDDVYRTFESTLVDGRQVFDMIVNSELTERITIEYEVDNLPPAFEAEFAPSTVNIRNGQTPAAVPILNCTFSHTDRFTLTGITPNSNFNGGQPLGWSVPYSSQQQNTQEFISWDFFDKAIGSQQLVLTASNLFGRQTQKTITVNFVAVTGPVVPPGGGEEPGYDTHIFITDCIIDKPAIERNHTLTVEYSITNVSRLLLDDGTGNERLADVEIGVEDSNGRSIILNANVPTLKKRRIPIDLPEGSYRVFAQVEGGTFPLIPNNTSGNPSNTRLYANTILTVVPPATPAPPERLTVDDVIAALIPVVNDQLSIEESFSDLINDRKILRNLLVSEDSRKEYLILNYIQDVDESVILKLYDPIEQSELPRGKYYIAYELVDPFVTTIELDQQQVNRTTLSLRGPNFEINDPTDVGMPIGNINLIDISSNSSTELLRYDELLNYKTESGLLSILDTDLDGSGYIISGSITTDILNNIIGGREITDDELGIDYTNYGNFVFYSSAAERLLNFKYKLGLIESFEGSRNLINSSSVSSSISVRNEVNYYNVEINKITSTFDGYEKFLFGSDDASAWPKISGMLAATTASVSSTYFTSQSAVALGFDDNNQYSLHKDLPEHIIRSDENVDFLLFISMLGHHFDLIKVHIDAINRLFVRSHDSNVGTPTKLVKKLLESFGWNIRTRGAQDDLINYLLGKRQNGSNISSTSAKARDEELHRRFLNNLPYIFKTKGTRASIRALFNMYGIPSSIIKIQEFGGPKLTSSVKRFYTFDDPTQLLNMSGSNQVQMDLVNTSLNRKPDSFEITMRTSTRPAGHGTNTSGSYQLLTGKNSNNTFVSLNIDSVPGSDFNGKLRLVVSGSTGNIHVTSSKFPVFDNDLYTIGLIRSRTGTTDLINVYAKKSIYELFTHEISASLTVPNSLWESASLMRIGNNFYGSVSEFRAWKRPISEDSFDRHVLYNESISGDHYTSSMNELMIRLPFENPQNLNTTPTLLNFAWTGSNGYPVSAATASNFASVAANPYQFEYIEIDSATEVPSIGFRADTDKIRFESQSLLDRPELHISTRITAKQFDQSPIDSNKLGIFISPTDEVNRDIIRSFGGLDFMNEIGNPSDYYSSSYSSLDAINEHYWSRHTEGMNIYDYITLVRQFDKTVFDYIDDIKPSRTKLVKGLLIEPHILERNKVQHKRPTKENLFWDGTLKASNTGSFVSDYPTYDANTIDTNSTIVAAAEYPTYTDTVDLTNDIEASGESLHWDGTIASMITETSFTGSQYPTYTATIRANVTHSVTIDYEESAKLSVIGFEENFKIPRSLSPEFTGGGRGEPQSAFGIYAENGYTNITFVKEGVVKRKRFKIELLDLPVSRSVSQLTDGATRGQEGNYADVIINETFKALNILHVTGSFTAGSERVNGYLPFHRVHTSDLTRGLRNSYYEGSKTSGGSFVDDSKAVETFISKPGILKVNKRGDSETEPILEIE